LWGAVREGQDVFKTASLHWHCSMQMGGLAGSATGVPSPLPCGKVILPSLAFPAHRFILFLHRNFSKSYQRRHLETAPASRSSCARVNSRLDPGTETAPAAKLVGTPTYIESSLSRNWENANASSH
jgi:hypothetical protein